MSARGLAWVIVLAGLGSSFGVAMADDPPAPTRVVGRVTDVLGHPVTDARVYVLSRSRKRFQTRTDKEGRYAVEVSTRGTHGVVVAIDKAHTFRTVIVKAGATNMLDIEVELDVEGGEVIKIVDRKRPQPAVKPKPTEDPQKSLPYSDEAIERDAWARAWFLLDIDATGAVTRLKLLKRPGFDLDRIAIEEAFKLQFEPARDAAGRPMSTYVVWSMEWPSWGWLVTGNGTALRKPKDSDALHSLTQNLRGHGLATANWARPEAAAVAFPHALARVPCAGSGPLNLDLRNRAYRDCSEPDLRDAEALPWITRETAETAIAELAAPSLELTTEVHRGTRVPDLIATGVTGGLAIATVVSFLRFRKYTRRAEDLQFQRTTDPDAYHDVTKARDSWAKRSLGISAAFVVSGAITLFLWNRDAPRSSFSVQPSTGGGVASVSATF